jgi:hypothetical protein
LAERQALRAAELARHQASARLASVADTDASIPPGGLVWAAVEDGRAQREHDKPQVGRL